MAEQLVHRRSASVEGSEQAQGLLDRQLVGELRLLQLHAEPLPQARPACWRPPAAQHLDVACVRLDQPFENLDRGRLAGAVGPEQAKALAAFDFQVQSGHGDDIGDSV